jgi:hypothetical protein
MPPIRAAPVAVSELSRHEIDITGVGLDEPVAGVAVIRSRHRPVLRIVVDADHAVATIQQLLDHIATDEPGRTSDEYVAH